MLVTEIENTFQKCQDWHWQSFKSKPLRGLRNSVLNPGDLVTQEERNIVLSGFVMTVAMHENY